MRIGVDGRALSASRQRRGVAVYLERLLPELARLGPDDEYRVLVDGEPRPGAIPDAPNVVTGAKRASGAARAAAALAGRPRLDRRVGGADLVWIPAPAPVAVSHDAPHVLTVHDLSFAHRPDDFSGYERLWHRLARPRRLAERASRVLTDTAHVRSQLLEEWELPAERVRAVLLGPGRARAASAAHAGAPEPGGVPYVLAVGALESRKLPLGLARAHALAREKGLHAGLVFAGDGPLREQLEAGGATLLGAVTDAELDAAYAGALCLACVSREEGFGFTPLEALAAGVPSVVSELPVFTETLGDAALRVPAGDGPLRPELETTGATLLGTATDDELGAAYANALCLACVSREEGFGFTPLEALAAGVPPVVSDLPVFTETLGEAALRVPADDADALSDALLRLEGEPDLREQLVKAGRARIADMTWERAALDTRAVFGEALA